MDIAPPALHLGGLCVRLCRWLTAAPLSVVHECDPLGAGRAPRPAEQLLLYLACDLTARCGCAGPASPDRDPRA